MSLGGVLWAWSVGCQGDSAPDPLPIEEAPAEMAKSICPRAYDCCTSMQLQNNKAAGTSEASCEVETADSFRQHLKRIKASENKGRLVYHGDKLAACAAYIRSASCAELNRTSRLSGLPCEPYLEPKVATGGRCELDDECSGGFCGKDPGASEGRCRAHAVEGESCPDGARCGRGLACRADTKVCIAQRGDGAPCTQAIECQSGLCSSGTCAENRNQCFYASACAMGPRGASVGAFAAALIAVWLFVRTRRSRSASSGPS